MRYLFGFLLFFVLLFSLGQANAAGVCFCLTNEVPDCVAITQAECSGYGVAHPGSQCTWDANGQACSNFVQEYNKAKANLVSPASTPSVDTENKIPKIKAEAFKTLSQLPVTSPQQIIGLVVRALTMFMGSIMFVLVVYAGVMWMTAQGNSDRIEKSKKIMVWAALGVAVMLLSYIVVNFVFTSIQTGA